MKHRIKITTLSPVCIGSGQKLSPIADYIYDNKQIHYLNKAKIEEVLAQDSNLMDKYIQGIVYGIDNNKTNFPLKKFLENNLKLSPNEYILHSVDTNINSAKELNAIIKNASDNCPYIPGSSLKGAIKTAFLYDWLKKEENPWKSIIKNVGEYKTELEKQFDKYNLSIHDSNAFSSTNKVIETKRFNLYNGKEKISTLWECIAENQTSETEIWNIDMNWVEFCKIINTYSYHQSLRELDILEKFEENHSISYEIFEPLHDFCENLIDNEIDKATNTAYLRIGNGKGYYFNSIGEALYNADDSNNKGKFLKFLNEQGYKKISNADEFPHTSTIEFSENKPLGWIKLELIK